MSKKQFTAEEIIALKGNPWVERVSELSVSFTEEFKRKSYGELLSGKPMWQIFQEHGIDTDALGAVRVLKFQQNLNECAKRGDGFKNQRNAWRRTKSGETESIDSKRIARLENEVAYLRQVVEFLKKSREADTEARKSWESKRRPK